MIFKGKRGKKNRENLIESLRELTRPEVSDFRFDSIAWIKSEPVLKLKGHEETPDFSIIFGTRRDGFATLIVPDSKPEFRTYSNTVCRRTKQLAQDIWLGCVSIMIEKMRMFCYMAQFYGEEGWLKVIPPNQIKFISAEDTNPGHYPKGTDECEMNFHYDLTITLDSKSLAIVLPFNGKPLGDADGPRIVEIRTAGDVKRFLV